MTYPKIFKLDDFNTGEIEMPWQGSYSNKAQSIFEAWLRENGEVVYGSVLPKLFFYDHKQTNDTHQALLINIQEIEKKECEHKAMYIFQDGGFVGNKCSLCGKKIAPKNWEVVE